MRLEIRADGVDFLVSRAPEPKKDGDGRQKADRDTGELLYTTELIAMDDTGGEVIKVVTAGEPKVVKKQSVKVTGLVVTPWAVDGRSGLSFRAESITPVKGAAA
jgi:hypothetical protein